MKLRQRAALLISFYMMFIVIPSVQLITIPPQLVDQFRITAEEIGTIGHWSVSGYLIRESEAMVLARVALGEAPNCPLDQIYIMWNIKLRAELGYKNYSTGPSAHKIDRWGAPNSIHEEALCIRGCQYEVVKIIDQVFDPRRTGFEAIALMLHPTDDQLGQFYRAYANALDILASPLKAMPAELIGYDGFLAGRASGQGWSDWINGNDRVQFYECGNVWNDKYKEDNRWFALMEEK